MCLTFSSVSKIIILILIFAKSLANLTLWREIDNKWKLKVHLARRIKELSLEVKYVTFITDEHKQNEINLLPENYVFNQSYSLNRENQVMTCHWNETQFCGSSGASIKHTKDSMMGVNIRVTTIYNPPLTMLKVNDSRAVLTGFIGDIWHDMQDLLKFRYTIYTPTDGNFGNLLNTNCHTNEENNSQVTKTCKEWSGMIGQVVRGEVDVIATPLTMTNNRLAILRFSTPLIYTSEGLFIRLTSGPPPSYIFYFQPFSRSLWCLFAFIVFLLIPVTHATLCWFAPRCSNLETNPCVSERDTKRHVCDKDMASVFHWLLESLGIFCQQGLQYVPHALGVRLTLFITLFTSSVIYNVYSGSLASFLAVERQIKLPFNSLEDLLHSDPHSGFSIGVLSNSSLTTILSSQKNGLYKDAWDRVNGPKSGIISTRREGFSRACRERFAFFTLKASYEGYKKELPCELYDIPESNLNSHLGITMSKEYPYAAIIDDIILKMNEVGVLNRQRLRWWPVYHVKEHNYAVVQADAVEVDVTDPVMKISFEQVTFAFYLLFIGCILSLVILMWEKILWHECNIHRRKRRNQFLCHHRQKLPGIA